MANETAAARWHRDVGHRPGADDAGSRTDREFLQQDEDRRNRLYVDRATGDSAFETEDYDV
jgi:hypothetical protein